MSRPALDVLLMAMAVALAGAALAYVCGYFATRRDELPTRRRILVWSGHLLLVAGLVCGGVVMEDRSDYQGREARAPHAYDHKSDLELSLTKYLEGVNSRDEQAIREWLCQADRDRPRLVADPPFATHLPNGTNGKGSPAVRAIRVEGHDAEILYTAGYHGDLGTRVPDRFAYLRLEDNRWLICIESSRAFEEGQ